MSNRWEFPEDLGGREKSLQDFRNFLYLILHHVWGVDPTPIQYDIADKMQRAVLGGDDVSVRLMVQAQRGEGKSVLASVLVCWVNYWWPAKKCFVVSASEKRAIAFTTFTLTLLREVPFLQHLLPDPRQGDRMSALSYDLRGAPKGHDPSVKAVGVMGQMAGSHADLIVPDDIEIPNNSDTPQAREKLKERTKELEAIGNPGHRQVWLGTPQSEDTVYQVVPQRGVQVIIWPGQYPGDGEFPLDHYEGTLADTLRENLEKNPSLAGTPTDTVRFPASVLAEKRATYGLAGFSLQFMLNPSLSDAAKQPLKLRDMVICDLTPETVPRRVIWCNDRSRMILDIPSLGKDGDFLYRPMQPPENWTKCSRVVFSVDQSGAGADETAWAAVGEHEGMLYLLGVGGFPDGSSESLRGLAEKIKFYNANVLLVESNFGGQTFAETLRSYCTDVQHSVQLEYERASAQKELRIVRTLEPVLASHRLVVSAQALREDYDSAKEYGGENWIFRSFMYQLTRMTRDRGCIAHDDRVDAVSQGIAFLAQMAVSPGQRDEREQTRRRLFAPRKPEVVMMDGPPPRRTVGRARKFLRG